VACGFWQRPEVAADGLPCEVYRRRVADGARALRDGAGTSAIHHLYGRDRFHRVSAHKKKRRSRYDQIEWINHQVEKKEYELLPAAIAKRPTPTSAGGRIPRRKRIQISRAEPVITIPPSPVVQTDSRTEFIRIRGTHDRKTLLFPLQTHCKLFKFDCFFNVLQAL